METLILFFFIWCACRAIKSATRPRRRQAKTNTPERITANLAILRALQSQRDELTEQLDVINAALDAAPPEAQRMRWMKERSRVYGQLATVENKISKLIG